MRINAERNRPSGPDHPSETTLVKHLDHELGANGALRVQIHVASCRSCRGKIARMREALGAFAKFYEGPFTDVVSRHMEGWR